jgi:hypothetical protein
MANFIGLLMKFLGDFYNSECNRDASITLCDIVTGGSCQTNGVQRYYDFKMLNAAMCYANVTSLVAISLRYQGR